MFQLEILTLRRLGSSCQLGSYWLDRGKLQLGPVDLGDFDLLVLDEVGGSARHQLDHFLRGLWLWLPGRGRGFLDHWGCFVVSVGIGVSGKPDHRRLLGRLTSRTAGALQ